MSFMGGLFGGGPSYNPPAPPNAGAVSQDQATFNRNAALQSQEMNMVNQAGPFGSMNYVKTGTNPDGTPIYSLQTSLNAQEQGIYTSGGKIADALLGSGAGSLSGKPIDLSENATETRLNQLYHNQNDPIVNQQREALTQTLYNRGIRQGDAAYDATSKTRTRATPISF